MAATLKAIKPDEFDENNMIFEEIKEGSIGSGKQAVKFKRVVIKYRQKDGKIVPLIIGTPPLFSYGVMENTSLETKKVTGYSLALYLPSDKKEEKKEGKEEKADKSKKAEVKLHPLEDALHRARKRVVDFMIANAEALELGDFDEAAAKHILPSLINVPKEKTKKHIKRLFPHLMWYGPSDKGPEKMLTKFQKVVSLGMPGEDPKLEPLDPKTCIGACKAIAGLQIDNLFVGAKVKSIQMKCPQALIMDDTSATASKDLLKDQLEELKKQLAELNLGEAPEGGESGDNPEQII
jgi:hypothetical protein